MIGIQVNRPLGTAILVCCAAWWILVWYKNQEHPPWFRTALAVLVPGIITALLYQGLFATVPSPKTPEVTKSTTQQPTAKNTNPTPPQHIPTAAEIVDELGKRENKKTSPPASPAPPNLMVKALTSFFSISPRKPDGASRFVLLDMRLRNLLNVDALAWIEVTNVAEYAIRLDFYRPFSHGRKLIRVRPGSGTLAWVTDTGSGVAFKTESLEDAASPNPIESRHKIAGWVFFQYPKNELYEPDEVEVEDDYGQKAHCPFPKNNDSFRTTNLQVIDKDIAIMSYKLRTLDNP